jgi:hypothetical protein
MKSLTESYAVPLVGESAEQSVLQIPFCVNKLQICGDYPEVMTAEDSGASSELPD